MNTPESISTEFAVTGCFAVDPALVPVLCAMGTVVGYRLPDGRVVRLVVAVEIEEAGKFTYTAIEADMDKLGLGCLDYTDTYFK